MKSRLIFATFIGGFIAWIYLSFSWFFLPNACNYSKAFKNEKAVAATLIDNSFYDGIYVLPNLCENSELDHSLFVFGALKLDGVDGTSPIRYLYSLIIQCSGAFFIALVMTLIKDQVYWKRILSGFLISMVAALVTIFIPDGIWWGFPLPYLLFIGINLMIAWTLASIAIAFII